AACMGGSPISMCRTMFSSITMASSTTKPTESVNAISERLSSEYPNKYMMANVPTMDMGSAMLGIAVADRFRRNRKMTRITRTSARNSVNLTAFTDERIETDRSYRVATSTDGGITVRKLGSSALIESTTSTVLVPGWR